MTIDEWDYVINQRGISIRWAKATVNGVRGVVLLPDNWASSVYALNTPNGGYYENNTIPAEDWTNTLEANGAVFLPAAGYRRYGTSVYDVGSYSYYWSSSYCTDTLAYSAYFYSGTLHTNSSYAWDPYFSSGSLSADNASLRNYGFSVRLVRSAQ